ncbi:DUF2853 family protein [Guyparkeria hydrothermalis]|uniref:DUF2853 family protein n=1 Tax=Guyparkeria hydrothermalis TaxID=923 RepID=UPI002021B3BB|nr:DUF2853 family protein [Guyparkeria hydrothermalis]MCL7743461.1 DUF2853 family protein [Guyparkeria hydrothermalis]
MSHRDELIDKYASELSEKCGVTPDRDLLTRVVIGLGPAVYNRDASMVAGDDPREVDYIKTHFLIDKLGLSDGPDLDAAIDKAIEQYGRDNRHKYRAVIYYLLTRHFGRDAAYP